MSEPVAASNQQTTLGPAPLSPNLKDFGLAEGDLKRLPSLWFDEFVAGAPKRFFNTYVICCILIYFIIFHHGIHLGVDYIVGFFGFAFISIIPFGLFWLFMGFAERKFYSTVNDRFQKYCRYQNAMSAYRRSKADYDARLAKQQIQYWRSLSGVAFERELGRLFTRMGYNVQYTPGTADGGVDLCLRKNGKVTVVQCKAHNKRISIGVARELIASMLDFGADDAIIACFDGVTKPVEEYIKGKKITVLKVADIVARQREYG